MDDRGEVAWNQMIDGLRDGTRTVVREFCDRYGKSLERLAEKHLTGGMRRRVGAEDVVQSACRTFLRRAQIGEFELADAQGLWGLLCAITLTKVREQKRYHLRQKRGLDREVHPADVSPGNGARLFDRADSEPTPAEAAEFADQFTQLVAGLDDEERQLVDLKLQQCTNEEIAERMGCSERTVRRILKRVQSALTRQLERD
ncbi:MAG TPA: sigma-70 family RNA polymerase sigma factor [Pirellulales bacterium]|nr:sigma-70 family RNA polymerase sigma factor [Pirellulales bacterium]